MQERTFVSKSGATYKRVNRKQAKRLFVHGQNVIACPVNLRIFGPWRTEILLESYPDETCARLTYGDELESFAAQRFEQLVDYATAYNCNAETGRYLAYYVPSYVNC